MEIQKVGKSSDPVKTAPPVVTKTEQKSAKEVFTDDKTNLSKKTDPQPFVSINTNANYDVHYVTRRNMLAAHEPETDNSSAANYKSFFKSLPITDKGLDDESDDYAFAAYPKSDKKYEMGPVKAKLESFQDLTGVNQGTFRLQYGNTTGDKKFNFDGAAIGLELDVKQNGYLTNKNPEILLPIDNDNYFFEQRNLDIAENNGSITGDFALEGVKIGIKYEKGKGVGIGNVEFHDGAITTNIIDFTKKYPYLAIPIYTAIASSIVAGGYFMNKDKSPTDIDLGNITVYQNDDDKNSIRIGISPSVSLTGADKFVDAFRVPGASANILYKYDNNLTLRINGGYNAIDGAHVLAGAAMKF